jgi:hypothetical protein
MRPSVIRVSIVVSFVIVIMTPFGLGYYPEFCYPVVDVYIISS